MLEDRAICYLGRYVSDEYKVDIVSKNVLRVVFATCAETKKRRKGNFEIISHRPMSINRLISLKFTIKLVMLLLLAASTGLFFIARYVDQLYLQQPLVLPDANLIDQRIPIRSHRSDEENSRRKDIHAEFSLKVAALLRSLSEANVDDSVLTDHCEEENISTAIPDVEFTLQLRRLECYGQLLKDYKSELVSLNSLSLLPNERLTSMIGAIIDYVDKTRRPVKKLVGPERERRLRRLNIHEIPESTPGDAIPPWVLFQNRINKQALFLDDDDKLIEALLQDLATLQIDEIEDIPDRGTQIKLVLMFSDGSKALFKPKRVPRDLDESIDIYYMYEKERHTAEIAAYHLSRILGFNTVPPVAGRFVNLSEEIYPYLVDTVQEHFFNSPDGNLCFFGQCEYFCDAANSVCAEGQILEGSVAAFLPDRDLAEWKSIPNPWKRSYSKYNKTDWETTSDPRKFCESVRRNPPYNRDKAILNVVDASIFDFLMGNKDRHHFYTFTDYGNSSYYILIDNGKGFGRAHVDIADILAPLYQCCVIRFSTLKTLFRLHGSPDKKLSRLMKESLSGDALSDILTPAHLRALDRRVRIILQQVLACINERSEHQRIVIDDGYYFERE